MAAKEITHIDVPNRGLVRIQDLGKGESKALVLEALQAAGYTNADAARLIGVSRQYVGALDRKRKEGTLSPLVNLARKAVKSTLKGVPVGEAMPPKASDIMSAAKMVLDRSDPVVQKVEQTTTSYKVELKTDDRQKYLAALGIQHVIEGEFTVVQPAQIEGKHEEVSASDSVRDSIVGGDDLCEPTCGGL